MLVHKRQHHNQEQGLMRQDSFSEAGFEKYRKKTRKEQFLEEMDSIILKLNEAGVIPVRLNLLYNIGIFPAIYFFQFEVLIYLINQSTKQILILMHS